MIRTIVADDAGVVRRSLRLLLETTDDIRVVGEAANGPDAVRLTRRMNPDVVLMDLRMPGGGGMEAIEQLAGPEVENPVPVLVFTTFHLDEYVYGAFERGAVGYLLKKNPGDIPAAIRAAVNASALHSPAVRKRMQETYALGEVARPALPSPRPESLTNILSERELEVLTAIVDGLNNKEIADRLALGPNTVKWHIGNMLDKSGTRDRTQLAIWAVQHGLNP